MPRAFPIGAIDPKACVRDFEALVKRRLKTYIRRVCFELSWPLVVTGVNLVNLGKCAKLSFSLALSRNALHIYAPPARSTTRWTMQLLRKSLLQRQHQLQWLGRGRSKHQRKPPVSAHPLVRGCCPAETITTFQSSDRPSIPTPRPRYIQDRPIPELECTLWSSSLVGHVSWVGICAAVFRGQ